MPAASAQVPHIPSLTEYPSPNSVTQAEEVMLPFSRPVSAAVFPQLPDLQTLLAFVCRPHSYSYPILRNGNSSHNSRSCDDIVLIMDEKQASSEGAH